MVYQIPSTLHMTMIAVYGDRSHGSALGCVVECIPRAFRSRAQSESRQVQDTQKGYECSCHAEIVSSSDYFLRYMYEVSIAGP
jgi:chorismate synthase